MTLPADPAHLDELLRALSHHERRGFVRACLDEPQAAGTLAARSSLSLATVSEHLKVLRKTGLLIVEKDGRFWRYATDRARLAQAVAALAALAESGGAA
jgi:DNA-binding transcriptional ArsR family regulator